MFHEYHRQKYLKFLKQMQKRVVVRINDVFRISKTNELNVKLNFLFVKFQLKNFLNIFLIRIVAKFVWKFIISFRITYELFFRIVYYKNNFLQKLKYYFKIKYDIFIINSKRIFSMICFFFDENRWNYSLSSRLTKLLFFTTILSFAFSTNSSSKKIHSICISTTVTSTKKSMS